MSFEHKFALYLFHILHFFLNIVIKSVHLQGAIPRLRKLEHHYGLI